MSMVIPSNSIFISVANGLAKNQEDFVNGVESLLSEQSYHPITLGRNAESGANPLDTVRAIVSASLGTLVIAFARLQVEAAIEFPESAHSVIVAPRRLCTVWNQIEAAMTFQIGHPLLVLAEESVHREGILEPAVGPVLTFSLEAAYPGQNVPLHIVKAIIDWVSGIPHNPVSGNAQI